jgi:hypothetical protein
VLVEGGYKCGGRGGRASKSQSYCLRQVPISWRRQRARGCSLSVVPCPLRLGDCPSFYRSRREQFTCVSHYFSYVRRRGEQCHGADGRPGESCSSRGVVACPVLVQERLRGWRRSGWSSGRRPWADSKVPSTGGLYAPQWRSRRVLSPCTPTSSGMSSQCPAWRCSGGDGRTGLTATGKIAPAGLTSRRGPV